MNKKKITKIVSSYIIIAMATVSLPFVQTAKASSKSLFTPCQYKSTYRYYMSKGEDYLADNQFESAIESYQRALIVQPNSDEARSKIIMAKEMIRSKNSPRASRLKREALQRAVSGMDDLSDKQVVVKKSKKKAPAPTRSRNRVVKRTLNGQKHKHKNPSASSTKKKSSYGRRPVPRERIVKEESYHYTELEEEEDSEGGNKLFGFIPLPNMLRSRPKEDPDSKEPEPEPISERKPYGRVPQPKRSKTTEPGLMAGAVSSKPEKKPSRRMIASSRSLVTDKEPSRDFRRPDPEPIKQKQEVEKKRPSPGVKYPSMPQASAQAPRKISPYRQQSPDPNRFRSQYLNLGKFNDGINDKIQEGADNINSNIAPAQVRGDYRINFGATNDDFIWKDANADYHNMPGDTSWRYLFGNDRHNSYDKKIYSRLRIEIDDPITDSLKTYNEIVIDPWTFVGKKRVYVTGSNGDNVQMDLKYWSNVRRTINETYRTERGDIVSIQESKVHDGKTSPETYVGLADWGSNRFSVPEVEIDRMYVPLRKSWVEYDKEPYRAKVFFMASQEEALTSDDPLRLSNNKIWWEESPWVDTYQPSRVFDRSGTSGPSTYTRTKEPVKRGQWVRNLSFVAKDSDDQYLTFLRGVSFDANFDNGTSVKAVAACPRNLWDTYLQGTSIPLAIRAKAPPITEKLDLGALYTMKAGLNHNSIEAVNNVFALDGSYDLFPNTEILAETAVSTMDVKEAIGYDNSYTGAAAMIGLRNQGPVTVTGGAGDKYELDLSYNHMNSQFFPGLSNYRFTRKEFEFAKHIYFDKTNPENDSILVGDGMDVGRNAFKFTAKGDFPDSRITTRFDLRNVHSDGGEFIENVVRTEGTYKATPKLTLKGLAYYQHLPKTTRGIDPLMNAKSSYSAFTDYFAYEDIWLENSAIPGDKDPSIGAYSVGANYDFTDYFSASGILEVTNDPKDWPRGLLNNVYVTDSFSDGVIWDRVVPFLYSQTEFGVPPYSHYNIYKSRFTYSPFDPITVTMNYVYNENKYAMAIDDNSTHQGIEVEYQANNRLALGFLYQYTRQRDMYKEFVLNEGTNYDGHHNIFGALDYELNKDQHLTLTFGEFVGYPYQYAEEHNSLTALDTQHIVRVAYSGGWGEPRKMRKDTLDNSLTPLGPLNPNIPGAKFSANMYTGFAKYIERVDLAPVESYWEQPYGKLEFGMDAFDKERWEGSLNFGMFGTLSGEEKWDVEGLGQYQKDEMGFRGVSLDADFGWAFNSPSKYISFTPLVNAGYRRLEFERSQFQILGAPIAGISEVKEHFNVSYLGLGGKLDVALRNNVDLYTSGYWAPFVYAPSKNSLAGSFECNGGNIYHAEAGCGYDLSEKLDVNLGGFWDLQHLERTDRINGGVVNAELPDNKLKTFGLKLGGLYKF